jgi:secondary thiamine-phosphate synthase enzyme
MDSRFRGNDVNFDGAQRGMSVFGRSWMKAKAGRKKPMIIKLERVRVQSRKAEEAINITGKVDDIVEKSGVKNGVVNVMTCHTSSGLLVTEGIPCLEEDILSHFSRLLPEEENYHHRRYLDFDGRLGFNAESHLKSILGGIQCTFPIENGKMVRGSRQTIYFMEYDGPLERVYLVQVLGE